MPVEHVIWRIGNPPERLQHSKLDDEHMLEELIFEDMAILNEQWLLIGRQVPTAFGKRIDLLAVDAQGSLIIVELKKGQTPREVVAQAIDYATWVKGLDSTDVAEVFESFSRKYLPEQKSLDQAFSDKFGTKPDEDDLNSSHQIVIVAATLDASTERIVNYLNESNVPLNVVLFRVFRDGDARYLSRAWLIDPSEVQERATAPRRNEPWNGEYYVSFGHDMGRSWEDALEYGFISGGGARWYSRTLGLLKEGDRVWVNVPKRGYVGVGVVEAPVVKVDEFMVKTDKGEVPLLEAPIHASYHKHLVEDEDRAEYAVRVRWLDAVPLKKAKSEVGFFGNQNTVCRPTTEKWNHTVERLKVLFKVDDS